MSLIESNVVRSSRFAQAAHAPENKPTAPATATGTAPALQRGNSDKANPDLPVTRTSGVRLSALEGTWVDAYGRELSVRVKGDYVTLSGSAVGTFSQINGEPKRPPTWRGGVLAPGGSVDRVTTTTFQNGILSSRSERTETHRLLPSTLHVETKSVQLEGDELVVRRTDTMFNRSLLWTGDYDRPVVWNTSNLRYAGPQASEQRFKRTADAFRGT